MRHDIITWLEGLGTGWLYETGQAVSFERSDDALEFKISGDPFGLDRRIIRP
ncbi:hypothetical protein [Brevundimonas naejangsanensis]|uniref:hypothetical protein n=1 Tax=Brevundimonas naejangsanensis TaxID=588932 RepID=UPI0034D4D6ED